MKFVEYTPNPDTRKQWGWTRQFSVRQLDHPFAAETGIIHKNTFRPFVSVWTIKELRQIADFMESVKDQ